MERGQAFAVALIGFMVLLSTVVGADEAPVRGFDASAYEISFLRAAREGDPERWLSAARDGGAAARDRWERDAVALYPDRESRASGRSALEAWTEADLEERFKAWLRDRFFGREAAVLRERVSRAADAANVAYLYLANPDGTIRYDDTGAPLYAGDESGASLADDRASWNGAAAGAASAALEAFSSRLEALRPELLALIPEMERGRYGDVVAEATITARDALARELAALVAREERLFVARRSSDIWSLRSGSEREAASVIAARLVAEAGAACEAGLSALAVRIGTIDASAADPRLAGSDWLDDFSLQFDRGLAAWRDAEERFMVRRLEWERDAAASFDDGSEAWAAAYERLVAESRAWEAKASALLRDGEDSFTKAGAALEDEIARARADFERDATERAMASSERAGAWVDVYLQSCYAATSAREGAGYWLSLLGDDAPSFGDASMESWIEAEESGPRDDPGRGDTVARLRECVSLYDEYAAKALESRDRLIADFGLAVGAGTESLVDVLADGCSSDDFCLDEYQVELLRAEAVEGYWIKRAWIAQAVFDYAIDISSGRATESESLHSMEEASARYDEAVAAYGIARETLSAAGAGLGAARERMDAARAALSAAGDALEAANTAYATTMAALVSEGDGAYIRDELYARYRELAAYAGLSPADDQATEAGLVAAYLEKARLLGYAEDMERSTEALRGAVNGSAGEPSLVGLSAAYRRIVIPSDLEATTLEVGAFGLIADDPAYAIIEALLGDMRREMGDASDEDESDRIGRAYRSLAVAVAERARAQAAEALASRLDGIALLSSRTVGDWYAERSNGAAIGDDVRAGLESDVDMARRSLLGARARLELEAIRVALGESPAEAASEDGRYLAGSIFGERAFAGPEELAAAAVSLERLVSTIESRVDSGAVEFFAAIEGLASADASIAMFARGGGFFAVASCDLASLRLTEESAALAAARGRLAAYDRYGPSSVAVSREDYKMAMAAIDETLSVLGLSVGDGGRLPGAEELLAGMIDGTEDPVLAMTNFMLSLDAASSLAPEWVRRELSGWRDAILAQAAAGGSSSFDPLPAAVYRSRLTEHDARANGMATILRGLSGDGPAVLEAMSLAVSSLDWTTIERELIAERMARIVAERDGSPVADEVIPASAARIAAAYAGEYSGDALGWAARVCGGDTRMALLVARCVDGSNSGDPFARWFMGAIADKTIALMEDARRLSASLSCSTAFELSRGLENEAIASGRKHWREYLPRDGDRSAAGLPDGMPLPVSGWAEGASADAREDALLRADSFEMAMGTWRDYLDAYDSADEESDAFSCFIAAARGYLDDPESPLEPPGVSASDTLAYEYERSLVAYSSHAKGREKTREAIALLGQGYEAIIDPDRVNERLAAMASAILEKEARYDAAMAAYAIAADDFESFGAAYDSVYDGASASYGFLEDARTMFEKEDAIRRWASTAYLASSDAGSGASSYKSPAEELAIAKSSSARATAASSALRDLYADGESERPYEDPEYQDAYAKYKTAYRSMLLAAKARDAVAGALRKEAYINAEAYAAFQDSYAAMESGVPAEALGDYLAIGPDGALRLAYGPGFSFQEGAGAAAIMEYFSEPELDPESSRVDSTAFHIALDALNAWMGSIDFSEDKARQWGLARDYVLGNLVADSPDFGNLIDYEASGIDDKLLGGCRFVLLGDKISDILADYRDGELARQRKRAYESMGAEERAWFENYLALRVSGAIDEPRDGAESTYDGFSYWSRRAEYERLEAEADRETRICETGIKVSTGVYLGALASAAAAAASLFLAFLVPGCLATAGAAWAAIAAFGLSLDGIGATQAAYREEMRVVIEETSDAATRMTRGMSDSARLKADYLASCARMDVLSGGYAGLGTWDPSALREALAATGDMEAAEIEAVMRDYQAYAAITGVAATGSPESLIDFAAWSLAGSDEGRDTLELAYSGDENARVLAVSAYRDVYNQYLDGDAGIEALRAAADLAYGDSAPSLKNHLSDMAGLVAESGLEEKSCLYTAERSDAAIAYADLLRRVHAARLAAEFVVRSTEWDIARERLCERRSAWREAGRLVLERGRADFERGAASIRDGANAWSARFATEYEDRTTAWNYSSADMLDDKLSWVARATAAADEASGEAVLALVGADAEAAARRMDTVFVSAIDLDDGASAAYEEVLAMAGIGGMSEALAEGLGPRLNGMATIRSGVAGAGAWNSGRIRVAAADYAERVNRRLAGTQAAMMAAHARDAAAIAVAGLENSLRAANADFNDDMNRTFVADGKWRRSGDSYVKDVVVHSTVIDPYITEAARVKAYAYLELTAWSPLTDMSDAALEGLDPEGIRALIARAQAEVAAKAEETFGGGAASLFSEWIGKAPALADGADPDDGQASMFSDPGSGELGRMVAAYIFWAMKESRGWSEASKPVYEKDLWDDRGDWFQAPSIRGVVDIGVGVAAMALSGGAALPAMLAAAGVNLTDDLVFGALDGLGGYRAWGDVGFDFGKKALGSAASVAGSGLFFGFGGQASGFLSRGLSAGLSGTSGMAEVAGKAALSGLHAATTAIASSAIDSLYWKDGGFAWSGSAFASGVERGLVGSAGAMAGALVSGSLGLVDLTDANGIGLRDDIFDLADMRNLNAFAGGLAGSVVSGALTGDFVFNVLNASTLSGGSMRGGLVELRLGDDGPSMKLGTAGADCDLGTIASGLSGLADASRIAAAKGGALLGAYEGVSTLNAVNMLGYAGDDYAASLARSIWDGGIKAVYRDDLDLAEGEYGEYDHAVSPGAIGLSSDLLGLGKDKAALLASVMSHEGGHADGNRVEAVAIIEHLTVYSNLSFLFGLEMDSGFVAGSLANLADSSSWVANTGTIDNLRVRLDGSIYDDGNNDVVSFDDGRASIALGSGLGKQGALEAWLGLSGVKDFNAYVALIKASGNRLVDGQWTGPLDISRDVVDLAYKDGRISEEQYRAIIGDPRTDADVAAHEQRGLRAYQAILRARVALADRIAGNLIVPGETAFGSGIAGDPYIFTGQGGLSQIDFSAASDGRYEEIGPCYLMANSMPFLLMGASEEDVYEALLAMDDGMVAADTAAFIQDSTVFWAYMQKKLESSGAVSWYGGVRREMDWIAFESSGADMGLLWMDNPKRDDESQHWGFVYRVDDSWYFQDPWNPTDKGAFGTWGVESWEKITELSIRPIQITIP